MSSDSPKEIADFKKEKEKEEKEVTQEEAVAQELLHQGKRGKIVTYNHLLASLLQKQLTLVDWPLGWRYQVAPTDIGVVLEMTSADGRIFRTAFKTTGEKKYDLNAVSVTVLRAENTIDRLTGADKSLHRENIAHG